MRNKNKIYSVKNVIHELEYKKNLFFYHRYTKYVVDYRIEGDHIRVISNLGVSRKVKNTKSNMNRLNKTIIKNKIEIANKIDEYENSGKERLLIMFLDILLLCGTSGLVPLTLFIGSYTLFVLSLLLFSITVLSTMILGVNLYVDIKEIQNLKKITGYKMENEFKLPKVNYSVIKNKIKDAN